MATMLCFDLFPSLFAVLLLAPGSSSSELNRGFTCPSSALVEARNKTTVDAQASGFDERTSRKGCRQDGCTPETTRDNRRGANSRWSCKGDIVDGNGGCCMEYHFDEPQDIVVMKIAFYKGAVRAQTLNAYNDGEFHSQLTSSGSTNGNQTFSLDTDGTTDIKLCLDDYENNASQWLTILEVQFMLLA